MRSEGWKGVALYIIVAVAGAATIAVLMSAMHLSVSAPRAAPLVLAAMWMPALARFIATRTVDRRWTSPFPVTRWGHPRIAIVLVPLLSIAAIYLTAYGLASLARVPREAPVWSGGRAVANVVVNLPILAAVGIVGSLGEEIGWRGYLQPRLDQLGVRTALLCVIVVETIFHAPLILSAVYLAGGNTGVTLALFFGLNLGATPLWTWATYRWQSLWIAAWFHTFHNALSQVLLPKMLGAGSPQWLGESGVWPVAVYLAAAATALIFGGGPQARRR